MSVKIKLSYTTDEELEEVIKRLSSLVKSWKKQPAKGKYKRAYGVSNHERTTGEPRGNHGGTTRNRTNEAVTKPREITIEQRGNSEEFINELRANTEKM